jgi:hypothetical protein
MTSAARHHPLIAASSVLVCVALAFSVGAGLSRAQGRGVATQSLPQNLQRLWSTYPLHTGTTASRDATRSNRRASAPAGRSSSSTMVSPLVLALVGGFGAAGALAALLLVRSRLALGATPAGPRQRLARPSLLSEGLRMNDFVRRLFKTSDKPNHESDAPPAPASTAPSTAVGLTGISAYSAARSGNDERSRELAQPGSQAATTAGEDPQLEATDQASIDVGDQVAVILSSAKQAAERLQESAREEAERIRAEAKQAVESRLAEAKREIARRREEDNRLRAEAEAYDTSTREAADRHAAEMHRRIEEELAKQRAAADQEARETRRAAKRRAEELTSQALDRQRALIDEAKRSKARLEQLLEVFRAMTSQLEDLLGAGAKAAPSGASSKEAAQQPAGVLDEALSPQAVGKPEA